MQAHPLTQQRVRQEVPDGAVGFYRLGTIINEQFWTQYVGRSDTDLQRRLCQHARTQPETHFQVRVVEDPSRAYHLECRDYHLLEGQRLYNQRHPHLPPGKEVSCPYCGLEQQLRTMTDH